MGVHQVSPKAKVLHFQNSARIVVTIGHFQSFVMVREWDVPQRTFLVEKKLGGWTWHRSRLNMLTGILQILSLSRLTLYQVARTHMRHHQCPSTCFKEP